MKTTLVHFFCFFSAVFHSLSIFFPLLLFPLLNPSFTFLFFPLSIIVISFSFLHSNLILLSHYVSFPLSLIFHRPYSYVSYLHSFLSSPFHLHHPFIHSSLLPSLSLSLPPSPSFTSILLHILFFMLSSPFH